MPSAAAQSGESRAKRKRQTEYAIDVDAESGRGLLVVDQARICAPKRVRSISSVSAR